jgi:hypothetical protein
MSEIDEEEPEARDHNFPFLIFIDAHAESLELIMACCLQQSRTESET